MRSFLYRLKIWKTFSLCNIIRKLYRLSLAETEYRASSSGSAERRPEIEVCSWQISN